MTIILDNLTLPEKGHVEMDVKLSFDIVITAEEAKKKVRRWLMDEISLQISTDLPSLVVGRQPVWRATAYIGFPHTGRFSDVGFVNVDAATGELLDLEKTKQAILDYLEKEVKHRVPPYKPHEPTPDYTPKNFPPAPAPKFITFEDKSV